MRLLVPAYEGTGKKVQLFLDPGVYMYIISG